MKHLVILPLAALMLVSCGDDYGPGYPTQLECRSIITGNLMINRVEPIGTYFSGYDTLIKSRTPEGKRVWTFVTENILCVETEL